MTRSISNSKPRLVVRRGPNPDIFYILRRAITIVGREPLNDVVIPDPEVSRRHARIFWEESSFNIEDLNSTNGTYVNGRRIDQETRLASGDIIDFGETVRVIFEHDIAPTSESSSYHTPFPVSSGETVYDTVLPFPGDRATASPMRPTVRHKMIETSQHDRPGEAVHPSENKSRPADREDGNPSQISSSWFFAFGFGFILIIALSALALYLYLSSSNLTLF